MKKDNCEAVKEYYVIRDKNTGLYFRGKGVNRWGKYYNQATIYRVKGTAEHTVESISWKGEEAEVVRIQIVETDADVIEAKHGEWKLETHSFYVDNVDESTELCVYILASCSNCGEEHSPKQVFSKRIYAPEDAEEGFLFDEKYEKEKALEEFKQRNYKFQNYCSCCGAKMNIKETEKDD